jgi:uncharacterized membrane protein YqjE
VANVEVMTEEANSAIKHQRGRKLELTDGGHRTGGADCRTCTGLPHCESSSKATYQRRTLHEPPCHMALLVHELGCMAPETISTVDLVKATVAEARELVQLEVRIAREELKAELQRVKRAAIVAGLATTSAFLFFASLVVALILVLGATLEAALWVGLGFAVIAAALGAVAYATLPKSFLPHTRRHLMNDLNELKEHTP